MIHQDVARLTSVMPPHENSGESINWREVEHAWGTSFPSDFRDFMTVYGAGTIDNFLVIATPADGEDVPGLPRMRALTPTHDSLSRSSARSPYPAWPRRGGLIRWGGNTNATDFYWDTTDHDPDNWPVVVKDGEGNVTEYRCSMTVFILGLLGPRHARPLESPMLYGAPSSRFYHWQEERRLHASGDFPWEYLDALYEANEAEYELDEEALEAQPLRQQLELEDVLPPGAFPPPGRAVPLGE